MIIVNQIGGPDSAFGNDTNEVAILTKNGQINQLPRLAKYVLADKILDELHPFTASSSVTPHESLSQ